MNTLLAGFLAAHQPVIEEVVTWRWQETQPLPLRVVSYLSEAEPPLDYVTSARCVVLQPGQVLVVREPDGSPYVIPGGRREPGELPIETVRREVLEETGWELGPLRQLGFVHYQHQGPQPSAYPYPYPDFLQIHYAALAVRHQPQAQIFDPWVAGVEFYGLDAAAVLPLRAGQRRFLEAAVVYLGLAG